MTNKRLVRVADVKNLNIVGFGDIAVMFRPGESIIPLKVRNVAHIPEICYNLFSLTALLKRGHGFTGCQGGIVVSVKQSKRSMIVEKYGNLPKIYRSRSNSAGSAFIVMNDADDSHRANDKPHVVVRKEEKQGVTLGGCPTRRGKQREQRSGRQRAGWRIAGEDARLFAVTGVACRF